MEKNTTSFTSADLQQIAQNCLCLNMRQTTRLLTQWYDSYLQPTNLRLTQISLLVAIALAQPVPLTRLADILALDRTTLARNLKPLERDGLVNVSPGEDKRVRVISLTGLGCEHLGQALPYWREAQEVVRVRLGPSEWDALQIDLSRLQARLAETSGA